MRLLALTTDNISHLGVHEKYLFDSNVGIRRERAQPQITTGHELQVSRMLACMSTCSRDVLSLFQSRLRCVDDSIHDRLPSTTDNVTYLGGAREFTKGIIRQRCMESKRESTVLEMNTSRRQVQRMLACMPCSSSRGGCALSLLVPTSLCYRLSGTQILVMIRQPTASTK
ncbi:unnamed protein product [Sphagnum jensenii]|uniref:Uncharacterized protein n=1 Tax=Sphagnum jensenii TaxID=128206 RepID=A0ABP0X2H3_9BRYO